MKERRVWLDFWSRVGTVSIRTKIMGIVAASILLLGIALVWYASRDVSTNLRSELQRRGIAIGTSLVEQSRDLVLTDNQFALYSLMMNAVNVAEDIAYAFVLDDSGNVLVHTFDSGFPPGLLKVNQISPGASHSMRRLQTEQDIIQDVAIPILGGKAGVLHLGLSESSIRTTVAAYTKNILAWVALALVLGLSLAYALSSFLSRPLSDLAQATRAVGSGDFRWQAPPWAKDEIGALGTAFSEMSKELKRKEEMRVQLLAKVIDAQESERKRIARELHDETSQSLTSLMVGLKSIEGATAVSQAKEKAAELRTLAAQTLEEVHHLAMELRPSLIDDLGLVFVIQRYTEEYSTKMQINIDCQVDGLSGQRLSPQTEVAVYRIIQEALTNIAKHAEAKNVSIILNTRDSSLVAIIEDDGKGFDVDAVMTSPDEKKLGLFGMRERAALIGGKLSVESYQGTGTTVFLQVPLDLSRESHSGQDKSASGR